uniref:Uncharacterized protein n=1 Tax=Ascaris lumbricoides TaxID=6252 RepID=A0A0M3IDQ9_ASCLU
MRHDGRRVDGLAGKHVLHHAPQLCTERTLLLSACKKHGERCSACAVNVAASGKTPPRFNIEKGKENDAMDVEKLMQKYGEFFFGHVSVSEVCSSENS